MKNIAIILFKLATLILILYQLYNKVYIEEIFNNLRKINIFNLTAAFICLNISYCISALRFKGYIKNAGINISYKSTLNIGYRSSMVSNFLPGGVGGEGYKIYILNKIYLMSIIDAFKVILSDRGSGLLALAVLTFIFAPFAMILIPIIKENVLLLSILGLILNLVIYRFITQKYLSENLKLSSKALFISIIVQLLCTSSYYFILSDISPNVRVIEYSIVFFLSSIALIFPISIGGIGIREISIVYSSYLFDIDTETAIAGSIIFYIISLLSSIIIGGYFFTKRIGG